MLCDNQTTFKNLDRYQLYDNQNHMNQNYIKVLDWY